ncbi:MAG: hypothetical protein EXR75_01235 [Myxococcales bacterium]|nr:hypothetical protein [Myxococcales bacterium]
MKRTHWSTSAVRGPFLGGFRAGLAALGALLALGCQGARPVLADATKLGNVIVYRNGVAYFERYAEPGEEHIELRVPSERVDDFLKSLSIIDEASGKALPVSYPTMASIDGYVAMRITLGPHNGRLRITYVTESPAWKPSYRIVLGEDGKASLQGWAVVDNVSGEDWDQVRIGVGSTSALSFRFDLHSVRLVERETLGGGGELALAPPTGGAAYAVAASKVRMLSSLGASDVANLTPSGVAVAAQTQSFSGDDMKTAQKEAPRRPDLRALSQQIKSGKQRVRIEGYAQAGDGDLQASSMFRANLVRQELLDNGVSAEQLEVVATGKLSSGDAVRVLASDDADVRASHSDAVVAAADSQPAGLAHFVSKNPMTIAAEHSAMVNIFDRPTSARRVYYYDPVSERGSKTYAFNAVRVENPTQYTLDGGPVTVYASHQFLGEGLSDSVLPSAVAFVPYALDRSVVVETSEDSREEIEKLVTLQRGVATAETRRIRRRRLTVANRGNTEAEIYLRHQVAKGYQLIVDKAMPHEKLGSAYLFALRLAPGKATELAIEETTPLMRTVDVRTDDGVSDVAVFLEKRSPDAELARRLREIVEAHRATQNLRDKIRVLHEQVAVYRARTDELTVQLFSLKKVREADKLRASLARKMEEITDKMQKATIEQSYREGELMTVRIGLEDKIAELSLEPTVKAALAIKAITALTPALLKAAPAATKRKPASPR